MLALETRLREGEVVLHPKYLEWVARLEEEYVRMMERTQRVETGDKELELAYGREDRS